MTQGAVSSRMPELPVVHLAHLVETGTWFAIGGVVGGAVLALLIRLRGWSWTCALPLLVAVPDASLLSWRAELCADAFAVAAVGIGAWRHLADLRAGGDLAQRARDRVGPMTPIRRWYGWRKLRNGEWVTSAGRGDRVHAEGRAGSRPGRGLAGGHVAPPRRNRVRQDDLAGLAGARRNQARVRCHLHRSEGRRLRAREAARRGVPRGPAVPRVGSAGQDDLQPLRPGHEHRDRRQAARGRGVHRAALPAARAALHRSRRPGVATCRRAGQPRDRGRAHAQRTPGVLDPQDDSDRRSPAARVPRDFDAAAGAGSRRAPATGSRSWPSQTSVICWTPQPAAYKSISASRSTAATSSSSGSRPIGDRSRQRCSAPRSSRISSRSAKNGSRVSTDPRS